MRPPAKSRATILALLLGLAAALLGATPVGAGTPTSAVEAVSAAPGTVAPAAVPNVVRQRACPHSQFTCITLRVPRDHFGPAGGPTFDVTFGLLRASSGRRKGVFVTVTGGPGTSGLAAADSYTAGFDPRIPHDYDIVFFDQRGVGQSEALQCPRAALAFYATDAVPTVDRAQAQAYVAASEAFARDCVVETKVDPARLPFYATRQAVEDLEAFRAWLGAVTIDLYGESYGTQYVQTYAAAHPERLHSLSVDGPVDLTLTGTQYYAEQARAFDFVLAHSLDACTNAPACRHDVTGHDALDTYDDLAGRLRHGPQTYSFVTATGVVAQRQLTLSDLETAAAGYVYSTFDRMLLQRAVGQASRGQLSPLARLTYLSLGQDPETLHAVPDPTYSDAMFYAVECMDYDYRTGSPDQSAQAYLAAGLKYNVASVRLGSVFYGDLPCAFWPAHPATSQRPAPLTTTPFPVFVFASTWDPATPYAGALRIFRRLSNAYLVVTPGGPHIIFGRGHACPDDLLTTFLVIGDKPASRRTTCGFAGTDPYVPIPVGAVGAYEDALAAMIATDDEINTAADYAAWSGSGRLVYGCLRGGWIRYAAFADGSRLTLHGCAFSTGLALTGKGTIDTANGTFSLDVTAPGGTDIDYTRDANGLDTVSGTYRGKPVSISR